MKLIKYILSIFLVIFLNFETHAQNNKPMELATFGTGCFWCTEAIFQQLKGVESAVSGYSGGLVKNCSQRLMKVFDGPSERSMAKACLK